MTGRWRIRATLGALGLAFALPAAAARADVQIHGDVVSAAIHWSASGPDSFATVRAEALRYLARLRAQAAADLAGPFAPDLTSTFGVRARGHKPWYRLSPAGYFVNPAARGARYEGMIIGIVSAQSVYRCSGSLVSSRNGSTVLTAGHCIVNREFGGPVRNIVFIPYAQQGPDALEPAAPFGVWPAAGWAVTKDWYKHGSARHIKRDLGALLIARDSAGRTLRQVLGGAQRLSFAGITGGRTQVMGYPAGGIFSGNDRLVGCGPRPIGRVVFGGSGPNPVGIACGMTQGASGGPWLQRVSHGVGTIISVTSESGTRLPLLAGPVLDNVARDLFTLVAHHKAPNA